jgi:hypothetical protein
MSKLENMRTEIKLIEGNSEIGVADVWKEKCKKLIDICKSFKEENERLYEQSLLNNSWNNPDKNDFNLSQDNINIKMQSLNS